MDKLVLRPAEVADVIGLSRSRVYQLIASGEIPSFCIGGMRRVAVEQLREWVAQKQREAQRQQREHGRSNVADPLEAA
jgi:excisionase family DNA binding protein